MPSSGTAHSGKVGSVAQSLSAWGFVDASSRLSALRGKVLSAAEVVSAARPNFFWLPSLVPTSSNFPARNLHLARADLAGARRSGQAALTEAAAKALEQLIAALDEAGSTRS